MDHDRILTDAIERIQAEIDSSHLDSKVHILLGDLNSYSDCTIDTLSHNHQIHAQENWARTLEQMKMIDSYRLFYPTESVANDDSNLVQAHTFNNSSTHT